MTEDSGLAARLRRLDAGAATVAPDFSYDAMLERHERRQTRAATRHRFVQATATVFVIVIVGASVWRFDRAGEVPRAVAPPPVAETGSVEPRIVRASTYLAVAALEDHIASLDEALNDARLGGGGAEVERLERARAELVDSYSRVRYAELVSANF